MIEQTKRPIFIIGAARSGTSALAQGLLRGAGLPGYNEGHILPLLHLLHQTIDKYFASFDERLLQNTGILAGALDRDDLKKVLSTWFAAFLDARLPAERWVDKTPDVRMIQAVPVAATLFPQAQFVFARRRGIENVMSRTRKFPGLSFEKHCELWAVAMAQWLEVRAQLPDDRFLEIDMHELALHPEATADAMGRFLSLTEEQIEGLRRFWTAERPEQSRAAQDHRYLGLDETGWTNEQKATFVRLCGPAMARFGYELEGRVFRQALDRPIHLYCPVAGAVDEHVRPQHVMENGFHQHGRGFLLHPNLPGKHPAEVRYEGLEFFGHNHFCAYLFLRSEAAEPVAFSLRIESTGDGACAFETNVEVGAGPGQQWEVEVPALHGAHDVVIATAMGATARNNHKAWAIWQEPHFCIRSSSNGHSA